MHILGFKSCGSQYVLTYITLQRHNVIASSVTVFNITCVPCVRTYARILSTFIILFWITLGIQTKWYRVRFPHSIQFNRRLLNWSNMWEVFIGVFPFSNYLRSKSISSFCARNLSETWPGSGVPIFCFFHRSLVRQKRGQHDGTCFFLPHSNFPHPEVKFLSPKKTVTCVFRRSAVPPVYELNQGNKGPVQEKCVWGRISDGHFFIVLRSDYLLCSAKGYTFC